MNPFKIILSKINKLSIRKKIFSMILFTILGGLAVLAIYVLISEKVSGLEKRAAQSAEMVIRMGQLETNFNVVALDLSRYLALPKNEYRIEVELAEIQTKDASDEMLKLKIEDRLRNAILRIEERRIKELKMLEQEMLDTLENEGSDKAQKYFDLKYNPLFSELKAEILSVQAISQYAYNKSKALSDRYSLIGKISIGVFIIMGICSFSVLLLGFGNSIAGPLEQSIQTLTKESQKVAASSATVSAAVKQLTDASTNQQDELQKTASAVEEMSAMISRSTDNAIKTEKASEQSANAAERGKASSILMLRAMDEINSSNEGILSQVEASNQRITEINKVITEIAQKTKVINDIVFQTKLLSFNASVEAARAGEHGKGFSVVAEEVGNLAQMSGKAAQEIEKMLAESIQWVDSIVVETKTGMEKSMIEGKQKVEQGIKIAKENQEILEDIAQQASTSNSFIREIVTAAVEQAKGVDEIAGSMGKLENATQLNLKTTQNIADAAGELSLQAQAVEKVDGVLRQIVWASVD